MKDIINNFNKLYGDIVSHNINFSKNIESSEVKTLDLYTLEKILAENPDKKLVYETPTDSEVESFDYCLVPFDDPNNFMFYIPARSIEVIEDYIVISFKSRISRDEYVAKDTQPESFYYTPDNLLKKLQTFRFNRHIDKESLILLQVIEDVCFLEYSWESIFDNSRAVSIFSATVMKQTHGVIGSGHLYLNAHY